MPNFEIDEDIRRAWTLPSEFYTDSEYFELSKELIFARSWQFVCREDEVRSLRPSVLLPGFLDEPIFLSRSGETLRCLSNVCTHRGKILIEEECQPSLIRCRYHGRRFSLDGRFLSMPEFDDVLDFPTEKDDLAEYKTAVLEGFVFASCEPADSFQEFAAASKDLFVDFGKMPSELSDSRDYEVAAHWALYCENYLEGFHIPYVHKSLNEIVDYGTYTTELYRYSSLQTGFDDDAKVAGKYLFIFPNMMFNFYPWGLSINIVEPIAPDRTRIRYLTYVSDESRRDVGAGADLHTVELEDEAVVESVQKGIRSRFYDRGRYSPTREQGTHHFHRLIAEFMSNGK
jgi:choline monooxygenase